MNLGYYPNEPPAVPHWQQQQPYQASLQHCHPHVHPASPLPQSRVSLNRDDMYHLFQLCRSDEWHGVLQQVRQNPQIATTSMTMDNHISTTIIHQAITSKGQTAVRAEVISTILRRTPEAASIKNGYGSLPLHVIAQRNTKMDAQTKEQLIFELVHAFPSALTEEGGVGKRTPLHIIFTDYISPRLTRMMIDQGGQACFMKDKKGYLPAHVACSRHCSPEKLRMLLAVNPRALFDKTNDGDTLLDLAKKQATKSHPNYALIDELNRQLAGTHRVSSEEEDSGNRSRLDSNDSAKSWHTYESSQGSPSQQPHGPPHHQYQQPYHHHGHHAYAHAHAPVHFQHHSNSTMMGAQALLGLDDYHHHHDHQPYHYQIQYHSPPHHYGGMMSHELQPPPAPHKKPRSSRKRKTSHDEMVDDTQPAVDLLLHFSRNGTNNKKSPGRSTVRAVPRQQVAAEASEDALNEEPIPVMYHQPYHQPQVTEMAEV